MKTPLRESHTTAHLDSPSTSHNGSVSEVDTAPATTLATKVAQKSSLWNDLPTVPPGRKPSVQAVGWTKSVFDLSTGVTLMSIALLLGAIVTILTLFLFSKKTAVIPSRTRVPGAALEDVC